MKEHPWYRAYAGALTRCNNIKADSYKYYGGRGISFKLTTQEFKILWLEFTDKTGEDLKKFMSYLPNPKITGHYGEETITEIECFDIFEAIDIKSAKSVIKEDYYEGEIFTMFNAKTRERLFTEEDC